MKITVIFPGFQPDGVASSAPGGHFLDHPTTLSAVRSKEWYINRLGVNLSLENWEAIDIFLVKQYLLLFVKDLTDIDCQFSSDALYAFLTSSAFF